VKGPFLGASAIVVHDGDLLMVQRAKEPRRGLWALPGGSVEPGELVIEAAVRELREETGLEGAAGSLVGFTEQFSDDVHFVVLGIEVTVLERKEPVAADDATAARWVPLHEVAELPLVDGLAEFLHDHGVLDTIT
jgi:8-oxo-dGTP diphosphatase